MRTLIVVGVVFALAGCVSHELGDLDDVDPVPVYGTAEDVPCEYRLLRAVSVPTRSSLDSTRAAILGRAGARAGADAVIMLPSGDPPIGSGHPINPDRPVTTGRRGQGGGTRIKQTYPQPVTLNGQAIKCIEKN